MWAILTIEVLMLLQMGRIPTAFLQKLCDILCGVLLGFIEAHASRERIANLDMNTMCIAITLARCECALVERNTDNNLLVIDRRVERRRAVVANHIRNFIRGGSIVRRVVHDNVLHVLRTGLYRDFQIVFCRR